MKIQKRTTRRLRAAASKLFPDDEQYYNFIGQNYGVDSTLDLTETEAEEAIGIIDAELKALKRSNHGRRKGSFLTLNQKEYIIGMFDELGWEKGPRQWGFIEKQINRKCTIDMLKNREASKVIQGLEKLINDGYAKQAQS